MDLQYWWIQRRDFWNNGLAKCDRYRRMSVEERWEAVKRARLCFQCLGPHLRNCQSKRCPLCSEHHHSSLHVTGQNAPSRRQAVGISPHATPFTPESSRTQLGSASNQTRPNENACPARCHRYNASAQCNNWFYQTAVVEATGPRGCRPVRVLIDGGSDTSYVRTSLAEELGLPTLRTDTFACIGFQEKVEELGGTIGSK